MKKAGNAVWTAVLLALAGIFVLFPQTSHAAGETYQTALEKSYGDTFRSVYENRLAGSPLETEEIDGVDPATGHLILNRTDLSLEGNGGMDFELNRYYDSNEANLGHATVEHVSELEVDTVWVNYTAEDGSQRSIVVNAAILSKHKNALKDLLVTYQKGEGHRGVSHNGEKDIVKNTQRTKIVSGEGHNVYGLASGWRFDFPWIETATLTEKEGWGKIPAYLHYGSAGVINIQSEENSNTKSYAITGLEGYEYQDVKLEDFDQTVDGIPCRYVLRDKTGLRSYFNADGVIVLQKDAHDNTITFTYRDGIYFDTITDSVGRKIVFHYDNVGSGIKALSSVTVQGTSIAGGVSQKTIRYQTEKQSYTPLYGEKLTGLTLTSATVDGSKETYSYKTVERLVSTAGEGVASQRVSTNQSYLLNKVSADGGEQHYEYRACPLRGQNDTGAGKVRDVVTEQFYVTREYIRDSKTGKRSGGQKYDYFQKQGDRLISYADFEENKNEVWQYGRSGLQTVTVVSSFNANKYKVNGKYDDYKYKKSNINGKTLRLKKNTTKSVSLYIYNENKMLQEEVSYGKIRNEILYGYDKEGTGSLVTMETNKKIGTKTENISKIAYAYDVFRNMITETTPQAFIEKNRDKKHLYITNFLYFKTDKNYPKDISQCYNYTLCKSTETYADSTSVLKKESTLASNGVDIASITGSVKRGKNNYTAINQVIYNYDEKGNRVKEILYPNYETSGVNESITRNYTFNSLGQRTKTVIDIKSNRDSSQNRCYMENESTYDSFGNQLTNTDVNGNRTEYKYNEETGETTSEVINAGTQNESMDKKYVSEDKLKRMTLDDFGMCTVQIMDVFGNTIIEKNEKMGLWIERIYDYGDIKSDLIGEKGEDNDSEEEDESDEENDGLLIEEKVYAFVPTEQKFIMDKDDKKIPNYEIKGKGDMISASCYTYNAYGECIIEAEFSGNTMNNQSCVLWKLIDLEEDIEDKYTVQTSYEKTLDPTKYESGSDETNYYEKYDNYVLTENIIETKTNEFGKIVENSNITKQNNQELIITATNNYDEMERVVEEETVTRRIKNGKEETTSDKSHYKYDSMGNICEITTSKVSAKNPQVQSYTEKMEYDSNGRLLCYYDAKGAKKGYAVKYKYNTAGQVVEMDIPMNMEDDKIVYNVIRYEYSEDGKLTATETVRDKGENSRTEYSYDSNGNLIMVKEYLDGEKAQYTQYLYDSQGNQIRQYKGMTSPLTITLKETDNSVSDYSYINKKYVIGVSEKNKKDTIAEYAFAYDQKDQLISCRDPEGRMEKYEYDVYGNHCKTTDKKGNKIVNKYDRWNQLIEQKATDEDTKETVTHTYKYDLVGRLICADDTTYEYNDITGGVTREHQKKGKNLEIEKLYTYDENGKENSFCLKVGNAPVLNYSYQYDADGRLETVNLKDIDGESQTIATYSYDENDNLATKTVLGVNLFTEYSYSLNDSVTAICTSQGERHAKKLAEFQVGYTKDGQIKQERSKILDLNEEGKEDKGRRENNITYQYDKLGRLIEETSQEDGKIHYTYDANNNRIKMEVQNTVTDYHYNKNGELLRSDTLDNNTFALQTVIYKNDKNGNQLAAVNRKKINIDKEYFALDLTLGANRLNDNAVYHYNALDQLTSVLTKDKKVQFTYNAEGLREEKKVNGKGTLYVWDGDQLALELSEKGKIEKRYIRGNDLIFSDQGEGTQRSYYVMDAHGDVVQLVDESGVVIKTYEYDAFGNEKNIDKRDKNPFRYGGEYYDSETATVYLRERNYSPELGRFLTRDSYMGEDTEPLSLNGYTFCENEPVSQMDYNGNWPSWLKAVKDKVVSWGRSAANFAKKQISNANKMLHKTFDIIKQSGIFKIFVGASAVMAQLGKFDNNLFKLGSFVRTYDKKTNLVYYYAKKNCLQSIFGYNDFYDYVFDLGTSMNRNKVEFKNGQYVLWMWKGDYWNLGAGGEVGIYRKYKGGHWYVDKSYSLKMTLQLFQGKDMFYDRRPKKTQWWITGFVPAKHNVLAKSLRLEGTVGFITKRTKMLWRIFRRDSHKSYTNSDPKIWIDYKKRGKGGIATFKWQ